MPLQERRAHVRWVGNLVQGAGQLTVSSGAFGELPISWSARVESPGGKTSPEELLAAAHAACYAMALSHTLTQAGTPPQRLTVDAVCALEKTPDGIKIAAMDLEVHGRVPGLDAAGFERLAKEGEKGCPVSNALRHNVHISLKAHLEE